MAYTLYRQRSSHLGLLVHGSCQLVRYICLRETLAQPTKPCMWVLPLVILTTYVMDTIENYQQNFPIEWSFSHVLPSLNVEHFSVIFHLHVTNHNMVLSDRAEIRAWSIPCWSLKIGFTCVLYMCGVRESECMCIVFERERESSAWFVKCWYNTSAKIL